MLAFILFALNVVAATCIPFRAFAAIAAENGKGELNDDGYRRAFWWFMTCCLPEALWLVGVFAFADESFLGRAAIWWIALLVLTPVAIFATVVGAVRMEPGLVRRHTREILAMHALLIASLSFFIYGFGQSLGRMH